PSSSSATKSLSSIFAGSKFWDSKLGASKFGVCTGSSRKSSEILVSVSVESSSSSISKSSSISADSSFPLATGSSAARSSLQPPSKVFDGAAGSSDSLPKSRSRSGAALATSAAAAVAAATANDDGDEV